MSRIGSDRGCGDSGGASRVDVVLALLVATALVGIVDCVAD